MNEILAFIRAQLDTDERWALAANVKQDDPGWFVSPVEATGGEYFTVRSERDKRPIARVQRLDGDEGEPAGILDAEAVSEHIANHDVARVLRQVQAHRAILDEYEHQVVKADENSAKFVALTKSFSLDQQEFTNVKTHGWELSGRVAALKFAVNVLVSIYSDRDGYNQEWSA